MNKIIINQPALDYVTVSSFDTEFLVKINQQIIPWIIDKFSLRHKTVPGQVLQYKGVHYADQLRKHVMFVGQAEQKGEPHFLFRVSGFMADAAYRKLLSEEISCNLTRVDAQITCPCNQPIEPKLWTEFNLRQHQEESHRGYGRKVAIVSDNEKGHTLYIGSRQSSKFIRVYQKTDKEQQTHYVRLEVELKARGAKTFHENARRLGLDLAIYKILRWAQRGLVDTPLLELHKNIINQFPEMDTWKEGELVVLPSQTLIWWLKACEATSGPLLDCLETRDEFLKALHRLMMQADDRGVLHNEILLWCMQTCRARAKQMMDCPKTKRKFIQELNTCMKEVQYYESTNVEKRNRSRKTR